MSVDDILIAACILVAAVLYSAVGHGGASGYLAAMALFGLTPDVMRPSALALNIVVASVATWRFSRAGQQDWRLLAPFALTSVPAAFIGGSIAVPAIVYGPLVGVIMIASAVHITRTARHALHREAAVRRPGTMLTLSIGAALGLLSGLTGVGGGIFLSPLVLLLGWAATRSASGVAAAFILVNSIAGLGGTAFSVGALPDALPVWAMAALAGCLIGTQLGTRTLSVPGIRYMLALVLVVAGMKMALAW
ncbi:MAG: sulfite exporter TauE/SafE family protein [Sphingomonadales bacterium]